MKKFIDKVTSRLDSISSHVCVGLDSNYQLFPSAMKKGVSISRAIFNFNKNIIIATHHLAVAYKINLAFYRGFGMEGIEGLRLTNEYLKTTYNDIPIFADCKISDMGDSLSMVKKEIIEWLKFDCVMVTPWFGSDTVKELIEDKSCGVIVYIHDSNPSASEFQDVNLNNGESLYETVARHVVTRWNKNGNIFVEAGATYPKQLKRVREIVGDDMPILTAGIGSQGGAIENLTGVFGKNQKRLLVNRSRDIIFAGRGKRDYFLAVKEAADDFRKKLLKVSVLSTSSF